MSELPQMQSAQIAAEAEVTAAPQTGVVSEERRAINELLVLVATAFILLNQLGFALLENGLVRSKNSKNILIKNCFDMCTGGIAFWLIGFGWAFGHETDGGFIGTNGGMFASADFEKQTENYYLIWIFQYAFAATSATIVSGALAERTQLPAYLAFSILMTGFIYPVVAGWVWGGGWLGEKGKGFHDFAGVGCVHLVGGWCGFIGASILGPRHGKEKNREDRRNVLEDDKTREWIAKQNAPAQVEWWVNELQNDEDFTESSFPFIVFGTIMLFVTWLFFNAGSTLTMFDTDLNCAKIMMCTIISGASGGLSSAFLKPLVMGTYKQNHRYDVGALTNGLLSGLVSITGVCDKAEPWSAFLIGLISSVVYTMACALCQKLGVDDPIEASQVHGACGLYGLIAVGIFDNEKGLISDSNESLEYLGWQVLGALSIIVWVSLFATPYFLIMRKLNLLRVPLINEIIGIDIAEMGSKANIDQIIASAIFRAHQQSMKGHQFASLKLLENGERTTSPQVLSRPKEEDNSANNDLVEEIRQINLEIESERQSRS